MRDIPEHPLRRAANAVLNLVFPENCLACAAPVSRAQDCAVCDACWQEILQLRIRPPWCPSCGMPYRQAGGEAAQAGGEAAYLCAGCILHPPAFSAARSFGYYAAELSSVVRAFKFDGRQNLRLLLAPLMVSAWTETWRGESVDLIVPIPLHRKRERERGYNQAALLARITAATLAIPSQEKALLRLRHTPPQVGLSHRQRLHNLRSAFLCPRPDLVSRRHVLLIDDVMTTGATITSAARVLLDAGAARVSALTLARTITNLE